MYGMYYDYYGYECTLMCICDTIIECKKLFYDHCIDKNDYKEYFYNYTIVKLEKNHWHFFNKPLDNISKW